MTGPRAAALLAALVLVLGGCAGGDQARSAADQVPRLDTLLTRVDAALAAHHYDAARKELRALKSTTVRARTAGELRDADAARVLDAVTRLVALLPESSTTTGPTAGPTTSPTSGSSRPSPSATSRPTRSPTTAKTSSAPPSTPAASPTTAPAPTSSSGSATSSPAAAQVDPAAVATTPGP